MVAAVKHILIVDDNDGNTAIALALRRTALQCVIFCKPAIRWIASSSMS